MTVVRDVDHPDVDGVTPKMQAIATACEAALNAEYLNITTDDNLCSSVCVKGALDSKDKWSGGIWQNGLWFMFWINPEKGQRYYEPGMKVTVELHVVSYKLEVKFRKSTTTSDKVVDKIAKWIEDTEQWLIETGQIV